MSQPPQDPPGTHVQQSAPTPQAPQRQRRRRTSRVIFAVFSGILMLFVVIAITNSHRQNTSAGPSAGPSAAAASAPPSSVPPPAAPKPRTMATFTGSGIQNTARFTVGGDGTWRLAWSYDCSALGSSGNFIVNEDGDGDPNGANVNELGPGGHGSTYGYNDAGQHYLSVNSECSWAVAVISVP